MKTTKKDVIKVLRGESHLTSIEYKGLTFKYTANGVTVREANEYIDEKLKYNLFKKTDWLNFKKENY